MRNRFSIPRKVKVALYALGCLVLLLTYYVFIGCPTTFKAEFRRAERARLIGPSTIVDTVDISEYSDFSKMLVGETEEGICFFGAYPANDNEIFYTFRYTEKTGDLTIAMPPNIFGPHWPVFGGISMPVYLFAENPDAVRAEVEITVKGTRTQQNITTNFDNKFIGSATRSTSGPFKFTLNAKDEKSCDALYLLSYIWGDFRYTNVNLDITVPIVIKLYDAQDTLIYTETLNVYADPEQAASGT